MTRDYLVIPATRVSIKRLFNISRDIYIYRRSNLKPIIIHYLIILIIISVFKL